MYRAEFAKYYGKIPILEFLKTLSEEEQVEITVAIEKLLNLKNENNRISEKLSKYLKDGIFELRVNHLNKISRALYFYENDKKIIFTNGFVKKTNKTP
jgi:phage-related protein